jgi:hypothetical protein
MRLRLVNRKWDATKSPCTDESNPTMTPGSSLGMPARPPGVQSERRLLAWSVALWIAAVDEAKALGTGLERSATAIEQVSEQRSQAARSFGGFLNSAPKLKVCVCRGPINITSHRAGESQSEASNSWTQRIAWPEELILRAHKSMFGRNWAIRPPIG